MALKILCDFDGTITKTDTADAVFSAFAAPAWHDIEATWAAGEIGSAECMRLQMELVDASVDELNGVLDGLEIDPSFPAFNRFCVENGFELVIVSDGVDYFIRRILRRSGLASLPIRANQLLKTGDRRFTLNHPFSVKDCASGAGTCKCACESAIPETKKTVLIGDGRSDFCVSHEADIVFAKKSLLRYTREQGIASTEFSSFDEIATALQPFVPVFAPAYPVAKAA